MHKLNSVNPFIVPVNTVSEFMRKVSKIHFTEKSHIKLFWSPTKCLWTLMPLCKIWVFIVMKTFRELFSFSSRNRECWRYEKWKMCFVCPWSYSQKSDNGCITLYCCFYQQVPWAYINI